LTRGELEGIGAELQMKNNQIVIVAPMDDSPAQRPFETGDIILKVNGGTLAVSRWSRSFRAYWVLRHGGQLTS